MRKLLLLVCMTLCILQTWAQNRTVSGTISDDKDNPLSSVTINVLGADRKVLATAISDAKGAFSVKVSENAKGLQFSSIGYEEQYVSIGNKTSVSIKLTSSASNLSEVVVVGYGTQKKSQITGAIQKVGGAQLENVPMPSVDQMLQGKVPGLQSVAFNGQPGANQQIRIRGIGSALASSAPLYVLDGVQINSGDLTNSSSTTSSNVLATLNANDIEDITVLKDAAATSIYGARGANGVILITTKKGKAGKTQFRFDTELGQSAYASVPDAGKPLRADDWFALLKEGMVNANYTTAQINSTMATYGYGSGVDVDWIDLTTQKGFQQQYNLSMSGGTEKTQVFLSGGYFKQEGANIGSDLKRVTGNLKLTHNISSKLSVSTNWNVGNVLTKNPTSGSGYFGNPLYVALTLRPTQNPYNPDGTYNISNSNSGFPTHYNPLYIAANDKISIRTLQVLGGGNLDYKIIKGLKFTSHIGIQYNNIEEFQFQNPFHGDGKSYNGYSYDTYDRYFLWDWYNQLDYHVDILKDKNFSADFKVGYEAISSSLYRQIAEAQSYPPTSELPYSANAATSLTGKVTGSDYSFASLYSTASFNYDNRYSLYVSFRRDGSSRFGLNTQYGNFPAFGASWNATEEKFLKNNKIVSQLKLRGSYGSSGNAGIGNYDWRQLYSYGANYNGQAGGTFNVIGNTDLTWEKNKQLDLGIDVGILKNRVNFTFDWYHKVSDGLLFAKPISETSGFGSITTNIGKVENKGIELGINATPIQMRNFSWDISFNISHNVNKILTLPDGQDVPNGSFRMSEGRDLYQFYLRALAGVDPNTGTEMWYTDATRKTTTATYASAALQYLDKSALPKYFGALSNTFNYKGFFLTADFYYNYGNYVQDGYGVYFLDAQYPTRGKYAQNLKRWQKIGDQTVVPKYVYGQTNTAVGERAIYKGDYIRLRNASVGYRLTDKKLLDKMHLTSLNLYVRGTNLWTKIYDENLPFDPEQGVSGQNVQGLLIAKTWTIGLNVGF